MAATIKATIGTATITDKKGVVKKGKKVFITASGEANVKIVNDLIMMGTIPLQGLEDFLKPKISKDLTYTIL